MRLITRSLATLVILFAASTLAARADSYTYTFSESPSLGVDAFTYTTSTLITSTTTFDPPICDVDGYVCSFVTFTFAGPNSSLQIQSPTSGDIYDYIPQAFFTTLGANSAQDGLIFLNIKDDSPAPPTVPEPSTLIFLGTGLVAAAGAARRKLFGA